jgi:superfamily II DNA or RNA helicase
MMAIPRLLKPESWTELKLWPHQKSAVQMVRDYQLATVQGSALVRMPTGTGKSGVITVLCRCFSDTESVLVVVPWIALREQLADDISFKFFVDRLKLDPGQWPKEVEKFRPSTLADILQRRAKKPVVLLCTIQTLQMVYKSKKRLYEMLRRKVGLVLVDEGHREPALEWAEAVRRLGKPTVLFTATPYRNDHKVFAVNPAHVFAFTHHDAVEQRFIRDVDFRQGELSTSPEAFVETLLTFYNIAARDLKKKGFESTRVIVRCATNDAVNAITTRLITVGQKAIGIHDLFEDIDDDALKHRVPRTESTDAVFWVHQNKLIEGIDDPRFAILAIYQPLTNARALVQQVGRIVRNPEQTEGAVARVLCRPDDLQKLYWDGYRAYEEHFEENPDLYENRRLFDLSINLQPPIQYFEGAFRKRFSIDSKSNHLSFRFPLTALIYEAGRGFSLDAAAEAIKKQWEQADVDVRPAKPFKPQANTWVYSYVTYRNSPILLEDALAEFSVGFTICRRVGKYIFFYDSQGRFPEYLAENSSRVPAASLEKLFSGKGARVSQLSLRNSDLGLHSIRLRTIHAYSVSDTAPGLVDHAHFCSTVTGYTAAGGGLKRLYVGFTRSRVRDHSRVATDFDGYVAWTNRIARLLEPQTLDEGLDVFARFAQQVPAPPDPTPRNILLDIDEVMDSFERRTPDGKLSGEALTLDGRCYDVDKEGQLRGSFVCTANSKPHDVTISYVPEDQEYILQSRSLTKEYVRKDPSSGRVVDNLIGYVNRLQTFRVVPATPGSIYSHSNFYEPRHPLWGRKQIDRFELRRILRPLPILGEINSEKGLGNSADGNGWAAHTLFGLVDSRARRTDLEAELRDMDIVICDDMQVELADFVVADTRRRRVAFIHAKAFATPVYLSASALSVVCAQAVKNLEYLHPYTVHVPENVERWNRAWNGGEIGRVDRRIRAGEGTAAELWREIQDVIRDPSASREVWLLLGQAFSKAAFEVEQRKENPAPQMIQVIYLLQSSWGAVSAIGARFQIWCSP